jgi:hypothetical protein
VYFFLLWKEEKSTKKEETDFLLQRLNTSVIEVFGI